MFMFSAKEVISQSFGNWLLAEIHILEIIVLILDLRLLVIEETNFLVVLVIGYPD